MVVLVPNRQNNRPLLPRLSDYRHSDWDAPTQWAKTRNFLGPVAEDNEFSRHQELRLLMTL